MKVMECTICMKKITTLDRTITKCKHSFHFSCLVKNMKYNFSTGYLCPLCRSPFIKIKTVKPTILVDNTTIWSNIGITPYPVAQVPIGRSFPNWNRIVQNPIPTRNIARNTTTNHESEERRITKYIEDLDYKELKQELRSRGLSTRGYMRSSFEDRLFNAMRN